MQKNALYIARLYMLKENKKSKFSLLADYCLSNIDSLDKLTITELSERTQTSYATVCRFVKEIGVSGFREFKKMIRNEVDNQKRLEIKIDNFAPEESDGLSFELLSKKVCGFSSSVVENCYSTLKEETLIRFIKHFMKAKFVYFIGMGTSAVTALYAYTKLFRIKRSCSFDSDAIIAKMKASVMEKDDMLFVISSSGRTKAMVEAAQNAKKNGALIVSLCDFLVSPLSDVSDINICTTIRNSNKYLDTDFPLIQGQITIIDILYTCLCSSVKASSGMNFKKTVAAVKDDKTN